MPRRILRIPITNTIAGGIYTAKVKVGSSGVPLNLILDSGSSALSVQTDKYRPESDECLSSTEFAQEMFYGAGGWAGPIIQTRIEFDSAVLEQGYLALADAEMPFRFGGADGILGLAYRGLNTTYNLSPILEHHGIDPPHTFPWPFPSGANSQFLNWLRGMLQSLHPELVPTYFRHLTQEGITRDRFAFHAKRTYVSHATDDPASDPDNHGTFILGGGAEQTEYYHGDFINVPVFQETYYCVNLISIQVGNTPKILAPQLPPDGSRTIRPNTIVDSGNYVVAIPNQNFKSLLTAFDSINPRFSQVINQSINAIADDNQPCTHDLKIEEWPEIKLTLIGERGKDAVLTLAPNTYWQLHSPRRDKAMFTIRHAPHAPIILGLPLLNNYYTVFDRSAGTSGTVRFAPIKL